MAVKRRMMLEQCSGFVLLEELAESVVEAKPKSSTLIVIVQAVAIAVRWDLARTELVDSLQTLLA